MTQKPSQSEDLTACTFVPVPTVKSWDAGSGLETKEECDALSARSISFKENVEERLRIILDRPPGDKMGGIDKNYSSRSNRILDTEEGSQREISILCTLVS